MRMKEAAIWTAEAELEILRQVGFSNVSSVPLQNAATPPLKKKITVVNRDSSLKEVTVEISWPHVKTNLPDNKITIMTLISKYGVNR